MTTSTTASHRAPVLKGGEVGLCLTRIHHDRFTHAPVVEDAARTRLTERGIAFEAEVIDRILATCMGSAAVVNSVTGDAHTATIDLLTKGVDIVIGGRLRSPDGLLVGAPDILVRTPTGYVAIEVKGHKVLGDSGAPVRLAPLSDLTNVSEESDLRFRSFRKRDLYQVAHYWRLLDSLGFASTDRIGGVIGTDEPTKCTWVDLDTEEVSVIDEVIAWGDAALAAVEHGAAHPETPLERPWWRGECRRCDWAPLCHAELVAIDDPTLIAGIGIAERDVLADAGVTTGAAIADLELDDERIPEPSIVIDARVKVAGRLLRRDAGVTGMAVPSARREVDFDIETFNGKIYLAGFLVSEGSTTEFAPIVDWTGTEESERLFVADMFDRLAEYANPDTIVLHWSEYERKQLMLAAKRHGLGIPGYDSVADWFDAHALDLYQWSKETFVSPTGFSLKAVAPLCGFEWRDNDPGGLQSELWYEMLLAGDLEMRQRLLEYNEDDVAAQLAIRTWIRSQDNGGGPGSSIPAVTDWPLPTTNH